MHRSETFELRPCADCGSEISPARDRAYGFAADAFLCFDCAIRRGGRWDEAHDRWDELTDVAGLALLEK
jgi:RNA polymerase-binding transcription factor DksA